MQQTAECWNLGCRLRGWAHLRRSIRGDAFEDKRFFECAAGYADVSLGEGYPGT